MKKTYKIHDNRLDSYKEPQDDTSSSSYSNEKTCILACLSPLKKIFKDKASTLSYCGNWKHRLLDTA